MLDASRKIPVPAGRSGLGGGGVFTMQCAREPGNLARRGIAMERALAGGLVEHASRLAQLLLSAIGVGTVDRFRRQFDRAVYVGFDRTIALAPLEALAMALLG